MKKNVLLLIILCFNIFQIEAQLKIEGFVKQPADKRIVALVVVNDTVNKLAKIDSTNFDRRRKISSEGKLMTTTDEKGKFTVYAKEKDTVFFWFGRLFSPEKHAVSDLLKSNKIELEPKAIPCISTKKCEQPKPSKIYAFIGKKIDFSGVDTSKYCDELMDVKYKAKYKIEEEFMDKFPKQTIEFTGYDHNSKTQYFFKNYDYVLIFVGDYCGELVYLKYQFFPVLKTASGRWACPANVRYELLYKSEKYKPIPMEFSEKSYFDVDKLTPERAKAMYPEEYFKIENGKAYPKMGIYAEDLIKIRNEKVESKWY